MATAKLTEFDGHPADHLPTPGDGARATILLHGGHLVSWIPAGGEERLYLSPNSRYGEGNAVRGGVPVIFPQFAIAGPAAAPRPAAHPRLAAGRTASHGARARRCCASRPRPDTRALAARLQAEITVSVVGQQLDIEFAVTNTGDTAFEFSAALHTYLRTNDVLKAQLEGLQVSGTKTTPPASGGSNGATSPRW